MPIVHDAVIMLVCCVVRKNDRHYCQGLLLTHHLPQQGKNEFYEFDHQRKLHGLNGRTGKTGFSAKQN